MAMKRANGSGTVYKMKHKQLRKPYRAVVTFGYDANGKAIRKSVGTFATQKEAYTALALYSTTRHKRSNAKLRLANASNGGLRKPNAKVCLLVE